jgi:hypothetical protein
VRPRRRFYGLGLLDALTDGCRTELADHIRQVGFWPTYARPCECDRVAVVHQADDPLVRRLSGRRSGRIFFDARDDLAPGRQPACMGERTEQHQDVELDRRVHREAGLESFHDAQRPDTGVAQIERAG